MRAESKEWLETLKNNDDPYKKGILKEITLNAIAMGGSETAWQKAIDNKVISMGLEGLNNGINEALKIVNPIGAQEHETNPEDTTDIDYEEVDNK